MPTPVILYIFNVVRFHCVHHSIVELHFIFFFFYLLAHLRRNFLKVLTMTLVRCGWPRMISRGAHNHNNHQKYTILFLGQSNNPMIFCITRVQYWQSRSKAAPFDAARRQVWDCWVLQTAHWQKGNFVYILALSLSLPGSNFRLFVTALWTFAASSISSAQCRFKCHAIVATEW